MMLKSILRLTLLTRARTGEVSEWFKELVLKTSDSERDRGFESHPLRHKWSGTQAAEEDGLLNR